MACTATLEVLYPPTPFLYHPSPITVPPLPYGPTIVSHDPARLFNERPGSNTVCTLWYTHGALSAI
eukprot:603636-Rhodomonas_salina.1